MAYAPDLAIAPEVTLRDTLETIAIALTLVVVMLLGAFYALDRVNQAPWSCPSEDSCAVDYRGGRYHVDKVTP